MEFLNTKTLFYTKESNRFINGNKVSRAFIKRLVYICTRNSITFKTDGITFKDSESNDDPLMSDGTPYLGLPNNLHVGQKLKDKIKILTSIVTCSVILSNRVVETYEEITTEAGTFNCYLITYDLKTISTITVSQFIKEWYSKEVGVVKTETYNKKGKLTSTKLLTEFEK